PWSEGVPARFTACEDQQGNLFVGTYGDGVWSFDSAGKANHLPGLPHSFIWSVTVDQEGNLWVGTDGGGLNRVKQQVFDVLDREHVLTIQSVCEDAEGGLWFSINNGGVRYWKDGRLQSFTEPQGLANLYVRSVLVDKKQRVWAGTFGGGLFQLQGGAFRQAPRWEAVRAEISAVYQDRRGLVWVGTQRGLARWDEQDWKVFTTRDGLSANAVQAIVDDAQDNLWVGTESGGLNRLHEGQFTAFTKTNGLPSNNISSLYVDGEGVLWAGTSGGLARFDGAKWTRYAKDEGLINNNVGYLLEDGQGYLWLGSTEGLMRVEKKALNDFAHRLTNAILFRAYGQPDGLPTGECTFGSQPAACRTRAGKLWFPTTKGLATVDPAQLSRNTNRPQSSSKPCALTGSCRTPTPCALRLPAL